MPLQSRRAQIARRLWFFNSPAPPKKLDTIRVAVYRVLCLPPRVPLTNNSPLTRAAAFAQRNEFRTTLDALTNAQYVDRLIANTGVSFPTATRDQAVSDLNGGIKTRAQVLQDFVENPRFVNDTAMFNRAFVLAEYFGYLRRNPEAGGFNAWLNYLNTHPGDFRTMVNGFVNSAGYRQRFGAS